MNEQQIAYRIKQLLNRGSIWTPASSPA